MSERRVCVLLVEDNPGDARLIREYLAEARHVAFDIEAAGRLSEAMARISEGGLDAVLLDLGLPDSAGTEALARVRELAPAVPVVVLTGLDDEEVGIAAVREGAQDYLVKGQTTGDLLARSLVYAVERQRLETDLTNAYGALDRELKSVADVQSSLLPPEVPDAPGVEITTWYRPAERAGGDYFDFFSLPDGSLGVLVADVMGRGAPAAVLMAMTRVLAHTSKAWNRPDLLLADLNDGLRENVPKGHFVTAFYGVLSPSRREFAYACAGHPAPFYFDPKRGRSVCLSTDPHLALGLRRGNEYPACSLPLSPGGALVVYTDGVTEARGPSGEMFGREGLAAVLDRCGANPGPRLRDDILAALDAHRAGVHTPDDTTLVILRPLPE